MTPTLSPENEVKVTPAPKKEEEQMEFDPSFFDGDDDPYIKRSGKLKIIVILLVVSGIIAAVLMFFLNKPDEKRIVAVQEEKPLKLRILPHPLPNRNPRASPR
jgi:hypothetical protein